MVRTVSCILSSHGFTEPVLGSQHNNLIRALLKHGLVPQPAVGMLCFKFSLQMAVTFTIKELWLSSAEHPCGLLPCFRRFFFAAFWNIASCKVFSLKATMPFCSDLPKACK